MQPGTYRIIPVKAKNHTQFALVSPEDYDHLAQFKWHAQGNGYAARNQPRGAASRRRSMHREILGLALGDGMECDHINRDRLDNRRENLRAVTRADNAKNKGSKPGSASRFRGVYRGRKPGRWMTQAVINGECFCLGTYDSEEEAAAVVNTFWVGRGYDAPNDLAA